MEQLTSSPLDSSETMIGERTARTTAQTLLAPTRTPPSPLTPRSTPPPVQTPPLVTCTNNESSTTYRTANATQCCPNPPKRKSTIRKSQSRAAGIHNNHNHNRPSRCLDSFLDERCKISRTMMLRTVLIGSLLTAAAACASLAYITLRNAETNTAVATYESVAASALDNAKTIATRKFQASEVTASIASWTHPNADEWPFIFINGYINITQKIADLAQSSTQAMIVFIDVNQTQQFEQHLKETYATEGRPPETGVSQFGFGIWKPDPNLTFPDGRLHDTTGENTWGGKDPRLVVNTFHNIPNSTSLLYNLYSEEDRGIHVDSMNACVERHMDPNTSPSCAVITDMLELKIRPGPAGLLFNPVFPANEPNKFVGFATTSIHWEEVLTNIVPDYVNGLTCVVSTATASFTFVIQTGGVVELMGPGDMHHNQYDSFAESVVLNDIVTGASTSAVYTLTVYPSDAMFEIFRTISPLAVALAFLGVIFLCTILFFFYDYLMRHEAEQRKLILDMKRRFVRFISHEIRTPLNTVCVGLELLEGELRKDTSKGRKQKDTAAFNPSMEDIDFWYSVTVDVKENAGIAVSILNDMLNYDKLETKTLDLEAEEINIWEIIEQTTHQFQLHAINRGIDLKLNWEPTKSSHSTSLVTSENVSCISDDPEVSPLSLSNIDYINLCVIGDDVRLSQVFRNIISNALKFTPQHGKIRISATHNLNGLPAATDIIVHGKTISNERRRGSLIVKISDSGVGLTKEQLHLLFAEGIQFDANKLQHGGGSGLGLSIAKGIVELHRGTIDAMSAGQGHGTTFLVELPLYELSAAKNGGKAYQVWQTHTQTEVESTVSGDDATSIPFIAKKILVVDDAQSSRKMLIRLLERDGHTCIQASNGQDAVQAIELDIAEQEASTRSQLGIHTHKSIDTILMDFEMPFMNGPDATRAIRGIGFNGTIIGVTGNVLSEDVDYFKESGADVVLAKPISMDRLREYWNPQCISERDRNRNITF